MSYELIRPMKAAKLFTEEIEHTDNNIYKALKQLKKWPKAVSLKVDGIRGVRTTDLYSCRMKLIPNIEVRRRSMILPYGFDMELYNPTLQYDEIESIVMSEQHEQHSMIQFHMIDWYLISEYGDGIGYMDRLRKLGMQMSKVFCQGLIFQKPEIVDNADQLMERFLYHEKQNGEGICFRTMTSPYKQGYSTLKEEYLIKLCRYARREVEIVDFIEQQENTNRSKKNSIGLMYRSSMKSRQVGKGTLGVFIVRDGNGLEFKVGTGVGLTESRRQEIWDNKEKYIGKQLTIKHKSYGEKDKPRSPVAVGFREEGY